LLATWLAHCIPFLYSSAADSQVAKGLEELAVQQQALSQTLREKGLSTADTNKIEEAIRAELKISRATHVAIAVLGLIAGIATFFAFRFWQLAVVLTSAIYMWLWYDSGVMAHVSLADAYRLKWEMATLLNTQYRFFLEDIVVPFVLIGSVVYVSTTLFPWRTSPPRK
jgi:hypothetical protein